MQGSEPFYRFTIIPANYQSPANAPKYTIYFYHFSKKMLQYIIIITLNLFKNNKKFASVVVMYR